MATIRLRYVLFHISIERAHPVYFILTLLFYSNFQPPMRNTEDTVSIREKVKLSPGEKWRILKNVTILSSAFMIQFTAFQVIHMFIFTITSLSLSLIYYYRDKIERKKKFHANAEIFGNQINIYCVKFSTDEWWSTNKYYNFTCLFTLTPSLSISCLHFFFLSR